MKSARPGVASAHRKRSGSFATLVDQVLDDEGALDGLAFAYTELGEPGRRALAQAVVRDAADPTHALLALMAVEESPGLRQRLVGLISRHGRIEQHAFLEGTETHGSGCLSQCIPGQAPESLHIAWEQSKIESIEIEPRTTMNSSTSGARVAVADAVSVLAPLLWRHLRSGGELPPGVEGFAGFFSAS